MLLCYIIGHRFKFINDSWKKAFGDKFGISPFCLRCGKGHE